ncbi:kinase-like domain-containing protein [Mycena filopes]|nr:kinase-like domain-containing protein [Mycena filopes]
MEGSDVFSLSDQVLSDKLQFVEEIGYGNWGSVWLCRPKEDPDSPADGSVKLQETKIAVKLVHRSKTSTTAARVRSLWNEMKIVRSFKSDPHPSIIPFHSFIITPSYALITMAFLPTLVPVEVDEAKAREWFHFLLSGVEFLHKRGVVHNDIKPANILLSSKNIPVLVDFGFAEKYDMKSGTAFHSNLSYGTPEYLSPERARGLPHDTRKSDVWSLGITFFEILIGRTPFEHSDQEQFSTKEDLEKYWARTLRGKWVGSWKMSKTIEKLLRRMISPNADLRCTASDAMNDPYWRQLNERDNLHRRSASYTSSVVFEKDPAKLASPWSSTAKENVTPPGLDSSFSKEGDTSQRSITRAKSQPRVTTSKIQVPARKRVPVPPVVDLSPIKGSPPASPPASSAKQNVMSLTAAAANSRRPLAVIGARRENLPQPPRVASKDTMPKIRPLADLTGANRNNHTKEQKKRDSVKDRVREWEREKERLREMERLDELERDRDAQFEEERERAAKLEKALAARERARDKENEVLSPPRPVAPPPTPEVQQQPRVSSSGVIVSPRSSSSFAINSFKHSVKLSFDKTLQFYKNTTLAQAASRNVSSQTLSGADQDDAVSRRSPSLRRESWEDEAFERDAKSSLPVVRHAVHNERVGADNRIDRMAIWMRNVEQVVEDARQNFASSSKDVTPLPPLPLAPLSRAASQTHTYRSASRLPRKVLAASQIFADPDSSQNMSLDAAATSTVANPLDFSEGTSQILAGLHTPTPTRPRRATVSARSPDAALDMSLDLDVDLTGSPSKRKEKSRSHADLLERRITPVAQLELEIAKPIVPLPSPRLSDMLDRSLFVAPTTPRAVEEHSYLSSNERSFDELTSSPFHVEPYPSRKPNAQAAPVPDSPSLRRLEGVYDRFLMATTGVKRLGKGYQSDNAGPVSYTIGPSSSAPTPPRNHRAFHSARRAMRPPVESENRQSASVDELGMMHTYAGPGTASPREGNTTITLVRRAFKAFVPGKTVSRRMSRVN